MSIALLQGCGGGGGGAPDTSSAQGTVDGSANTESVSQADMPPVPVPVGSADDSFTTENIAPVSSPSDGQSVVQSVTTPAADAGDTLATATASAAAVVGVTQAWAPPIGTKVANFNSSPDRIAAWSYINGPEYPGAVGSLSEVVSERDNMPAARLHYDLGCGATYVGLKTSAPCGRYVAMNFKLPQPVDIAAKDVPVLAFDMRNPQSVVNPIVRILDSTGQILQFSVVGKQLEESTGENWRRVYLPIGRSTSHYGGANDGILHPPIKNVWLGAGGFAQQQPAGYVDFDNVELLKAPTFSYELKPTAVPAAGAFYPTYIGRLAAATYTSLDAAHDKAKAVGINIVRRDLSWSKIEKAGVFDFSAFNIVMDRLAAKGMSVLWILDYGHVDHGGKVPVTDADRDAFARFAKAAALNFKGKKVVGFEVWNEPNGAQFWPSKNPLEYAKLYTKAATAIREADPNVKIIAGGTAGVDLNYSLQFAANVNPGLVDSMGVHPYTNPAPELFSNGYQPLKKAVASRGMNKPIWVTEWGYSSYGDFDSHVYGDGFAVAARNRQGILVLRKVLSQMALNVPFMTIYALTDYGSNAADREANFGLLKQDGHDKPGIVGLRSLYAAQNTRTFKGYLPDVPPGLHALRWDGAADKAFVIWTDQDAQASMPVKIPANATSIKRWDGTVIPTTVSGSYRTITLAEADGPIFVTVPL